MRDEIIEILEMISPGISVENNNLNLVEYLVKYHSVGLIINTGKYIFENNFDIEIPSEEKIEENFENIESIMEMIVKLQ